MDINLIIVLAIISMILGIVLVIRGFYPASEIRVTEQEQDVVPLSDIIEIKEMNKGEDTPKGIDNENQKAAILPKPPFSLMKYFVKESRSQGKTLREELFKGKGDSRKGIFQASAYVLKSAGPFGEQKKLQEKSMQLKQAQESMELSAKRNEELKKQLEEYGASNEQLKKTVEEMKDNLKQEKNKEVLKVKALEKELNNLSEEKQQLICDKKLFEKLKQENQRLSQHLKRSDERMKELLENTASLKISGEHKLREAQKAISSLKGDFTDQEAIAQKKIQESAERIKVLETQKLETVGSSELLEAKCDKIENFNTQLREKEKILQYELAKSRAQAIGLEKICEDFKILIDEKRRSKEGVTR